METGSMANASATTQSRGCGDFFNRRQKPATGGLSFRRSVSATAHFGLRGCFRGMSLCRKMSSPHWVVQV